MAKPLTQESKKTKPKFTVELDVETHERLIDYLILTDRAKDRNKLINELIKDRLNGKVLDNMAYIDLSENPYYFNKNELLENKKVIATHKESFHNIDELFVVQLLPNNLDDFNKEFETYCVGNNPNMHAGYYILPKYKDHDETHFSFLYDSKKEEIEIGIENPNNIDNVFKSADAELRKKKEKIKNALILKNRVHEHELENGALHPFSFIQEYPVMYSYHLNLQLHDIKEKVETDGELSEADEKKRDEIYFKGIYLK